MEPKAEKRPSRISGKWESSTQHFREDLIRPRGTQDILVGCYVLVGTQERHHGGLWVSDTVGEAAEHRDNPVGPTALEAKGFHLYF